MLRLKVRELKRAVLHELIDWQAGDLLVRASRRIVELDLQSVADVRAAGPIVTADPELHQQKIELEKFLRERGNQNSNLVIHGSGPSIAIQHPNLPRPAQLHGRGRNQSCAQPGAGGEPMELAQSW